MCQIADSSSRNVCQLFTGTQISARPLRGQTQREVGYRPLQFQKGGPSFIAAHDKRLPVAMRVQNPNPFEING